MTLEAAMQRAALEADALARRGLSDDGDVGLGDQEGSLAFRARAEVEGARDGKDDDAVRPADGVRETAGTAEVEIGDAVDGPIAPAGGECARAFRTRKRGQLGERGCGEEGDEEATTYGRNSSLSAGVVI